uniref:Uncharacterized protein n=1 Tax=Magallana gigas TaxID=29159 RepID=A0A8W8MQ40_MAGGI
LVMDKHGEALIIAREEEVIRHGNVLFGLVKPRREGKELLLESSAAMVNVLPRKRIYRMGSSDELETFRAELLKRPLVVQPTVLSGSGFQSINCFFSVDRENWTVMINQTHPKILGRLLMGIDAAKRILRRGEPFVLEFVFSDIIRRLYYDVVKGGTSSKYKYTDCEFGDIVIRYPGDFRHQGIKWEMKAPHMRFSFDDVTPSEIRIRDINEANRETRDTRIIALPRDELQTILPGWTFDEDIAEEKPYNYENYQICEEQNHAPIPASRDTTREQTGRIRGRSNRHAPAQKYEVTVELHAPPPSSSLTQETSFVTNQQRDNTASSEAIGPNRGNNSKLRKFNTPISENRVPYDNHAFTHDNEFEVLPTTDSYRGDEFVSNHRTDRYNDYYSSQKSPKHIVSRDYDVGAHARQFQTIEQLDARSSYSHASVI